MQRKIENFVTPTESRKKEKTETRKMVLNRNHKKDDKNISKNVNNHHVNRFSLSMEEDCQIIYQKAV